MTHGFRYHRMLDRDQLARVLDTRMLSFAMTCALVVLLLVFYTVTMVNMGAISSRIDEINAHPYPVTVAAGEVETNLVQLRTLSDRLVYVRTPEAVDAVEDEYASIDRAIADPLATIASQCRSSPEKAGALSADYETLKAEQRRLIDTCRDPATTDAEVQRTVSEQVDPLIGAMLARNSEIIGSSHQSFDALFELAVKACAETALYATVLMAGVLAVLAVFLVTLRRRNAERDRLQKNLEAALETARHASQAKSQFLASVSHDIRTPCSAIVGLTEIAERHVGEKDRVEECLSKITLSSHHLISLINDVLEMSKIESGRFMLNDESFSLEELVSLVDVIAQQQARTKQLVFHMEADDVSGVYVRGDSLRLRQVLLNLIGNAVKYTEPGGEVRLRVRLERPGCVSPDRAPCTDESLMLGESRGTDFPETPCGGEGACGCALYRFEIEDNGIGMAPEFVGRIFEPFERERSDETRSIEGTGLGMSITKSIVDQMGGAIAVKSERHHGTTFTVDLPLCLERADAAKPLPADDVVPTLPRRVDFSGVRVLVAEDDEINAEIACDIVGRTHAEVVWAHDGAEAVETVLGAPDGWFDLVFMDVEMPNMDGLEASRTLRDACRREGRPQLVIVAMTANAYVEDRRRAFDAGMDDYLVKPFGFADVCDVMDLRLPARSESDGRHAANESAEPAFSLV
ncbi:ATP-binding response regulator [Gordonibacter urolithinfaciens]|jgi:signal transduction histidine kinase/CheY-like chemotaxis protein|uniref:ATP-binding response regulator n=1 Tax=Gordonibacter urolithinfaciens TaxID=1335613 RepID=UPI001D097450|nr:ATP-binding protein [Gordonibacter urolithinfaciens]MCB7086315.1 response regulator [Gordonibacter urolithinfaciens]